MELKSEAYEKALKAREASVKLASTDAATRNASLLAMADALVDQTPRILVANDEDMARAKANSMKESLQDRLLLTPERIVGIADALRQLASENDVIGEILEGRTLDSGLRMTRVRVPLGVVAMIYEARPNVTADAAGLCIKTANACILRGGSAANSTNVVMTKVLMDAAASVGIPANAIQSIETTDRSATTDLMGLHGLVDVLIPRGGASLIKSCVENSKVPVIETGTGNCHTYFHASGDIAMGIDILLNAKCSRPGVCNACESLLIDEAIADEALPAALKELSDANVLIHGDGRSAEVAAALGLNEEQFVPATEEDWGTEYLAYEISVKVVSGLDEAISHINEYGTLHSEAIIASDYDAVRRFTDEIDAAAVYANASTRFTDGGEFGYGAEIGISTQKLHARGPMGLAALTTSKFILMGEGQVR